MELVVGNKYIVIKEISEIIPFNGSVDITPIPAGSICTVLGLYDEFANIKLISGQQITVQVNELGSITDKINTAQTEINKLGDDVRYINDGSHSFDELYYHRMTLFAILCSDYKDNAWKSWKHSDGSMYQDYFIVGLSTPEGDYSYHYHKIYWDKFEVPELETAPEWDGHEPSDINRLFSLLHDTRKIDPWVLKEIQLACSDGEDPEMPGYMNRVYNSAAKAYMSLASDGHSGMSIGITSTILNRLIKHKPLTPLTGADDEWSSTVDKHDDCTSYQNIRCSSVFKNIYADGRIEYLDVDMFVCENINNPNYTYHAGYISRLVRHLYPIVMPYAPADKPIVIYTEDFLYDSTNGDFDTVGVFYLKDFEDKEVPLNIFLAEKNNEFVVIPKSEYLERKLNRVGVVEV